MAGALAIVLRSLHRRRAARQPFTSPRARTPSCDAPNHGELHRWLRGGNHVCAEQIRELIDAITCLVDDGHATHINQMAQITIKGERESVVEAVEQLAGRGRDAYQCAGDIIGPLLRDTSCSG